MPENDGVNSSLLPLINLFEDDDQELLIEAFNDMGCETIAWYPSCGSDVGPVEVIEGFNLREREDKNPSVYIYTDVMPPFGLIEPRVEDPVEDGRIVRRPRIPGFDGYRSRVGKIRELKWRNKITSYSDRLCSFEPNPNTGRVFFLTLDDETRGRESGAVRGAPILYFATENLTFLVRVLLLNQIPIDTLIHVRDGGGSFGGSHYPMNFIYQAASCLRLKRVVSDTPLEGKHFDSRKSFELLKEEVEELISEVTNEGFQILTGANREGLWEELRARDHFDFFREQLEQIETKILGLLHFALSFKEISDEDVRDSWTDSDTHDRRREYFDWRFEPTIRPRRDGYRRRR